MTGWRRRLPGTICMQWILFTIILSGLASPGFGEEVRSPLFINYDMFLGDWQRTDSHYKIRVSAPDCFAKQTSILPLGFLESSEEKFYASA